MLGKTVVGFAFVLASMGSTYVSHWLTRGSVRLTGAELGKQYPERAWVRFVYPAAFVLIFFGSAFLVFVVGVDKFVGVTLSQQQFFIMGGLLGLIPFLSGVFTLLTGVIPVNRRRQYLYVYDEDLTLSVGLILIAQGLFFVMAAVIAILFW